MYEESPFRDLQLKYLRLTQDETGFLWFKQSSCILNRKHRSNLYRLVSKGQILAFLCTFTLQGKTELKGKRQLNLMQSIFTS